MKTILTVLSLGIVTFLASNIQAEDAKSVSYPLTTCVISGEKLGGMGKPYSFVYEGTEVQLCCPHCKPEFDKDPAKYIKEIRAAAPAAK